MLRTIRKGDPELARMLVALRKAAKLHNAPVWGSVAEQLARPRHQVHPVNVGHLARLVAASATVIVPGKVLAKGDIQTPLTVAAFHFSEAARSKIQAAGGTALTINDLLKSHPDGTGVRIFA
ncbi:MAG TPA: 50S ribosomal protein L18e [Thermoplasmata archaeon]|nr:50S ribosomal protein L18e [Thermoplasmata archaeon]